MAAGKSVSMAAGKSVSIAAGKSVSMAAGKSVIMAEVEKEEGGEKSARTERKSRRRVVISEVEMTLDPETDQIEFRQASQVGLSSASDVNLTSRSNLASIAKRRRRVEDVSAPEGSNSKSKSVLSRQE